MQAAQTVQQSDASYTGWSTAAALYLKAAAAFQAAGDVAQAQAATAQAQTLETALKIANAQAQAAASCNGTLTSNGCIPSAPPPSNAPTSVTIGNKPIPSQQASTPQNDSTGDRNVPTPCQDLSGPSGCQNAGAISGGSPGLTTAPSAAGPALAPAPASTLPRVVMLSLPQCSMMCDVLTTVGEVLPDFAEKLDAIKPETIHDIELPLYDGGPNTQHPFLPRRPLAPVTAEPEDLIDNADFIKDVAGDFKTLADLGDKTDEPEDHAKNCRNGFLDGAWKSFTAGPHGYFQKAKAATDSLVQCFKETVNDIGDKFANGVVVDPDALPEDN